MILQVHGFGIRLRIKLDIPSVLEDFTTSAIFSDICDETCNTRDMSSVMDGLQKVQNWRLVCASKGDEVYF